MNTKSHIIPIVSALVITVASVALIMAIFTNYSMTLFLFITTFLIGFLPPFIVGKQIKISLKECNQLSFMTLIIYLIVYLFFITEVLFWIVLTSPILVLNVWLSTPLAYKVIKSK